MMHARYKNFQDSSWWKCPHCLGKVQKIVCSNPEPCEVNINQVNQVNQVNPPRKKPSDICASFPSFIKDGHTPDTTPGLVASRHQIFVCISPVRCTPRWRRWTNCIVFVKILKYVVSEPLLLTTPKHSWMTVQKGFIHALNGIPPLLISMSPILRMRFKVLLEGLHHAYVKNPSHQNHKRTFPKRISSSVSKRISSTSQEQIKTVLRISCTVIQQTRCVNVQTCVQQDFQLLPVASLIKNQAFQK